MSTLHKEPEDESSLGFTQDPETGDVRLVFGDGRILPLRFHELLAVIRLLRSRARWWLLRGKGAQDPYVKQWGLDNFLWTFDHIAPEDERIDRFEPTAAELALLSKQHKEESTQGGEDLDDTK